MTDEDLREIIRYDPLTGEFFWKLAPSGRHRVGRCGWINSEGYRAIKIAGREYKAGRLAWFLTYGEWPPEQVDHVNTIQDDDRLENLRLASPSQNQANKGRYRNNRSGIKGVRPFGKKFQARIQAGKSARYLGTFGTAEEARAAYQAAARELFGEFARTE